MNIRYSEPQMSVNVVHYRRILYPPCILAISILCCHLIVKWTFTLTERERYPFIVYNIYTLLWFTLNDIHENS